MGEFETRSTAATEECGHFLGFAALLPVVDITVPARLINQGGPVTGPVAGLVMGV